MASADRPRQEDRAGHGRSFARLDRLVPSTYPWPLFSGANMVAMNDAPWGSSDHGHPGPRAHPSAGGGRCRPARPLWRRAESASSVENVTLQCDGASTLVVADGVDAGDDVFRSPARRAAPCLLRSQQSGLALLEVVAVAGQRPPPSLLRRSSSASRTRSRRSSSAASASRVLQAVEVHRTRLIDDLRAPVPAGPADAEHRALPGRPRTAMRPASVTSNGSARICPPASLALAAVSSALSTQMYVFHVAADGAPSGATPLQPRRGRAAARRSTALLRAAWCPRTPSRTGRGRRSQPPQDRAAWCPPSTERRECIRLAPASLTSSSSPVLPHSPAEEPADEGALYASRRSFQSKLRVVDNGSVKEEDIDRGRR